MPAEPSESSVKPQLPVPAAAAHPHAARPRRALARRVERFSTRLSECALAGLMAFGLTLPWVPPPEAGARFDQSLAATEPIAVRRVQLQPVAVPADTRPRQVAVADKPSTKAGDTKAPKPAEQKPSDGKPLPVPPSSAPSEQQPEQWRPEEIAEAKALCDATLKALKLTAEHAQPLRNGACGTPAPLAVRRIGQSDVELQPAATVNCRMAVALDKWIADTLQPAARKAFASPVTRLLVASSYTCRNRYGAAQAPISEHAFANAIDVSGVVLADGRVVRVLDGWGATAREQAAAKAAEAAKDAAKPGSAAGVKSTDRVAEPQPKPKRGSAQAAPIPASATPASDRPSGDTAAFLRELHAGACPVFGTVLGPEANDAHRDHLHLDMKARARSHFCE